MCCTSLLKLWRDGDLLEQGDGLLMTPQGIIVHESEILHMEQVTKTVLVFVVFRKPFPAPTHCSRSSRDTTTSRHRPTRMITETQGKFNFVIKVPK